MADEYYTHLEERDGDTHGDTSAAERTAVVGDGPRVALQVLENAGELELGGRDGQEEFRGSRSGHGLAGARHRAVGRVETEHVGNLLGGVLLGAAEHVRLGAVGVGKLVNKGLECERCAIAGYIPWCQR